MRAAVYILVIIGAVLGLGGGACAGACGAASKEMGKADREISGRDSNKMEKSGETMSQGASIALGASVVSLLLLFFVARFPKGTGWMLVGCALVGTVGVFVAFLPAAACLLIAGVLAIKYKPAVTT